MPILVVNVWLLTVPSPLCIMSKKYILHSNGPYTVKRVSSALDLLSRKCLLHPVQRVRHALTGCVSRYVDSKGWGNAQLGGSFALLRLAPEAQDVVLV